ncbi:MAG: exodeoxyribonuclease VII large subunit [Clostridia bacterium]|nr:exodeoxyribonuclease VII large subunit [Clostridia bacterium]
MFENVVTSTRGTGENNRQIISVSELNHLIARQLRVPNLSGLYVRGQVSGFTVNSGNWYFELKDSHEVAVRCAAWKSTNIRMKAPKNGDQVIVRGTVNFYEPRGSVTFVIDTLQADGQSALYLQFLQLNEQLKAEGLFDPERKRQLPRRPRKVAMVTSPQGAVIHDVCRVARNRDPGVAIVLLPVPVQGAAAAPGIVRGIEVAATIPDVDVIIVGRGGGSMEDLWCFNDERVVRAIAASPIPVISGVGHDTDTTLSDYAADVRAATPSQAAELAVPDMSGIRTMIQARREKLYHSCLNLIERYQARLAENRGTLEKASPSARIERLEHQAGMLSVRLSVSADALVNSRQFDISSLQSRMKEAAERCMSQSQLRYNEALQQLRSVSPEKKIMNLERELSVKKISIQHAMGRQLSDCEAKTKALRAKLSAINPNRVLERGYAFVTSGERIIQSAEAAPLSMTLHFHDGQVNVQRVDQMEEQNG